MEDFRQEQVLKYHEFLVEHGVNIVNNAEDDEDEFNLYLNAYNRYGGFKRRSSGRRKKMLQDADVKLDLHEKYENEDIKMSRQYTGCSCKDVCDKATCECNLLGIECSYSSCYCDHDTCGNTYGRRWKNRNEVEVHYTETFTRLYMEEKNNLIGV